MKQITRLLISLIAFYIAPLSCSQYPASNSDILLADFERDNYGEWKKEGEPFGEQPATCSFKGQPFIFGFEGKGFANSFGSGEQLTGKLISPSFTIDRDYLNVLIGGGNSSETTCLNVLFENKVVAVVSGENKAQLMWKEIDLSKWKGKLARIEIVDNSTDKWGHINVDQIILSDEKMIREITKEYVIDKPYLIWPIKRLPKQGKYPMPELQQ